MARIVVTRPKEWMHRFNRYTLSIDGVEHDSIRMEEVKEINLAAGRHRLQARMNWLTSNEMICNLGEDEILYVRLTVQPRITWVRAIVSVLVLSYILLLQRFFRDQHSVAEYAFWTLLVLALCTVAYDITVGRKSYLRLTRDDK